MLFLKQEAIDCSLFFLQIITSQSIFVCDKILIIREGDRGLSGFLLQI